MKERVQMLDMLCIDYKMMKWSVCVCACCCSCVCVCVGTGNSVWAGGEFRSVWNEEASVWLYVMHSYPPKIRKGNAEKHITSENRKPQCIKNTNIACLCQTTEFDNLSVVHSASNCLKCVSLHLALIN